MEDTYADIGSQLRLQAQEHLLATIETQALNGSGSPFTGILNDAGCASSLAATTTFAGLSFDDLHTCITGLSTKRKLRGASFVMHPSIYAILAKTKDSNGAYFYHPSVSMVEPKPVFGYPIYLSDNMPDSTEGSTNTPVILFGNLKYSLYGVRMGLEVKYFDSTMYAVQSDENFFRIRSRFASKVSIPGAFTVLKTGT